MLTAFYIVGQRVSLILLVMDLVLIQNSKHGFGVHDFESEGYSYQPVPSISEEVFWYRPGNKYLNTCNFMHYVENYNNLLKNSNNKN